MNYEAFFRRQHDALHREGRYRIRRSRMPPQANFCCGL